MKESDSEYKDRLMEMGFGERVAEKIVAGRNFDCPTHEEWIEHIAEHGEPPDVDWPDGA